MIKRYVPILSVATDDAIKPVTGPIQKKPHGGKGDHSNLKHLIKSLIFNFYGYLKQNVMEQFTIQVFLSFPVGLTCLPKNSYARTF